MNFNIVIVIPTFNNKKSILKVVESVLRYGYEVIVVDDGSDILVEELLCEVKDLKLHIIRHRRNLGKGEAILSGAKEAKRLGFDAIITIDGDGQHLASEIAKVINVYDKQNQIIIGARNFNIKNVPKGSKIGRKISNFGVMLETFKRVNDSLSGFRLYPLSIIDLDIAKKGFDFEIEVLIKHIWEGGDIKECDIECYYPKKENRVSHFKKFYDTVMIVFLHFKLLPIRFLTLKGFIW